jgi:hypothetical protein
MDLAAFLGTELTAGRWRSVAQEEVDRLIELTGDGNWIHSDTDRARHELEQGATIVPGQLLLALVPAGGLIGLSLNRVLSPSHLTKETQEVVRLGIGMISVLSSLVLGLLIATAKNSYDTTASAVRTYAAELALLNETLRDYGGDAAKPRDFLR